MMPGSRGRKLLRRLPLVLLRGRRPSPSSSSSFPTSSGKGGEQEKEKEKEKEEERRPHVWGNIPTGPGGGFTTAVGGGGRQFFVSGEQGEEGSAAATGEKREPVDFLAESKAFLDRVEAGLADMKEVNEVFGIERDEAELVVDLGPAKGKFTLQRDWTQNQLVLLSPVSGINKYECHRSSGAPSSSSQARWLSVTEDRHDLVGMLTRDLIRVAAGCPNI